ncbi:MAG: hypothetical protein A3H35_15295 [Betaproteobacteria bacterium RIFCSPLOWO2_02_FULL_62_17]|nr:MAG: hypothetical protein A3H35_15295 [Betaproteobacteria bacterium RIFCSPLOWO2_02_FULL_62_17]
MPQRSSPPPSKRPAPRRPGRARRDPDQLALGERPADQAELFIDRPGGKQPAARLRLIQDTIEAIDSLFHEAIRTRGRAAFDDFLAFVRRFNRFSAFNVMLIEMQRPGATAVGDRSHWRTIGRYIKPGSIPIAILWPFAPVRWMYELNDTYGKDVPPHTEDPFAVTGRPPGASWGATVQAADRRGIRIELTDRWGDRMAGIAGLLHGGADGVTLAAGQRRHRWLVRVNEALDAGARFATLAHELGHIYCGHVGAHSEGFWPDRSTTLNKAQKEMEAEAVAYLACKRMGLETRSASYLRNHATPENLLAISKRMIIEATNRIEARS